MKKKTGVIVSALAATTICASLIAGTTFALFSSESQVDVSITSAKVDLTATLVEGSLTTASGKWDANENAYISEPQKDLKFANGGMASVSGNSIVCTAVSPMDSISFAIHVENNSNIDVKYSTSVKLENAEAFGDNLTVTIDKVLYKGGNVSSLWTKLAPQENPENDIQVTVALDEKLGNEAQDQEVKLTFNVTAFQANAYIEDEAKVAVLRGNEYVFFNDVESAFAGLQKGDELHLAEGTYAPSANEKFKVTASDVKIIGSGEKTVLNCGAFSVSGQAGLLISGDNVTVEKLTVKTTSTNGDVSPIKVTYVGSSVNDKLKLVENVTIKDVTLEGLKGHGMNLHGVKGATIDNVTVKSFGKCAFSVAYALNVTFTNCTTVKGGWGADLGFMYKNNAQFAEPSNVTLGAGNTFVNGSIYSERPVSAAGGVDTIKLDGIAGNWKTTTAADGTWAMKEVYAVNVEHKDGTTTTFETIDEAFTNLQAGDIVQLEAKTYTASAERKLLVHAEGVTIRGVEGTVINGGEFQVDNQAAVVIAANGVTIENLSIVTALPKISALRIADDCLTEDGKIGILQNVTVKNVTLASAGGNGLNVHGVNGVTLDGVKVVGAGKCGFAFARATGVTLTNCTTASCAWGDIGMMDGVNDQYDTYATYSEITIGAGNEFGMGLIYSERSNDTANGKDGKMDVINYEGQLTDWTYTTEGPKPQILVKG